MVASRSSVDLFPRLRIADIIRDLVFFEKSSGISGTHLAFNNNSFRQVILLLDSSNIWQRAFVGVADASNRELVCSTSECGWAITMFTEESLQVIDEYRYLHTPAIIRNSSKISTKILVSEVDDEPKLLTIRTYDALFGVPVSAGPVLLHRALDTDIGYGMFVAGMARVIQFKRLASERKRAGSCPTPNPGPKFTCTNLHLLALTCIKLQKKNYAPNCNPAVHLFHSCSSALPRSIRAYQELPGATGT